MKTSRKQMRGYLSRLQKWQRMAFGCNTASIEISLNGCSDEGKACIYIFIHKMVNGLSQFCEMYTMREWVNKEENDERMRDCSRKLVEFGVIEEI